MREIKFRAWWPRIKEMQYFDSVSFTEKSEGVILFNKGQLVDLNNKNEFCGFDVIDNQVLMQYTGLKDKNLKEIYEGDIVSFGGLNYKIVFDRGCFYMEDSAKCDCVPWILDIKYHEDSEVIGNIYENPNLLTK